MSLWVIRDGWYVLEHQGLAIGYWAELGMGARGIIHFGKLVLVLPGLWGEKK